VVLTADERAELERLQAKDAEPEPQPKTLLVRIGDEALNVLKQLVSVHAHQVAPEVGQEIGRALDSATDAGPDPEPEPEPEAPAAEDQPQSGAADGAADASPTPIGDVSAAAVGIDQSAQEG